MTRNIAFQKKHWHASLTRNIAFQKKQSISILRDEKYLTYTALTLLNPDVVHKNYATIVEA